MNENYQCAVDQCDWRKELSTGLCPGHYRQKWLGKPFTKIDRRTTEERFWDKVDKNGTIPSHDPDLGPCWVWTGSVKETGYGQLNIRRVVWKAHRFAWSLENETIPDMIDHRCRNRLCVRISHLQPTTFKENSENSKIRSDNQSGYRGVHRPAGQKRWVARVNHNGRSLWLGSYETVEEAAEVARLKRVELYTNNAEDRNV